MKINISLLILLLIVTPLFADSFSWTGQARNDVGNLLYLWARVYDPEIGAFISKDPINVSGGINTYAYTSNNPINKTDPNGLVAGIDDAIVAGVGGISGIVGELISDVVGGDRFYWRDYGASFAGGAVGAEAAYYTTIVSGGSMAFTAPFVGGFAATTLSNTIKSLYRDDITVASTLSEAAWSGMASYVPAIPIAGVTAGRNSFSAIADSNFTKFANETIHAVRTSVAGKMTFGMIATDLPGTTIESGGLAAISFLSSFNTPTSTPTLNYPTGTLVQNLPSVGGVLIDKAAELIGSNLSDIRGATYDPVSRQIVFLGSNNGTPSGVNGVNLDYFYTAVQAVYGSAVPPFVTLDLGC